MLSQLNGQKADDNTTSPGAFDSDVTGQFGQGQSDSSYEPFDPARFTDLLGQIEGSSVRQREQIQAFEDQQRLGVEAFQRGERVGTQGFLTGERLGKQEYGTKERIGTQGFLTGERLGKQEYGTGERIGTQDYEKEKEKRDYKQALKAYKF